MTLHPWLRRGWGHSAPVNLWNVWFWLVRLSAPSGSRVGHQVEKRYQARFGRAVRGARELPAFLLRSPIESTLRPWRDILRPFSWERPHPNPTHVTLVPCRHDCHFANAQEIRPDCSHFRFERRKISGPKIFLGLSPD